jgi:hypothetical protein
MTELQNDLTEIKQTLHVMQDKIDVLELKMSTVNPQCYIFNKPIYTMDMPLSLSAAKSLWPMLEKEFDEYCCKHNITAWTPADSEQFYNEYIRHWRRLAS